VGQMTAVLPKRAARQQTNLSRVEIELVAARRRSSEQSPPAGLRTRGCVSAYAGHGHRTRSEEFSLAVAASSLGSSFTLIFALNSSSGASAPRPMARPGPAPHSAVSRPSDQP